MSAKQPNPFLGMKLSESARPPAAGPDQRLFTSAAAEHAVSQPVQGVAGNRPTNPPSWVPGKVGTQQGGRALSPREGQSGSRETVEPFAIEAPATEKNSYMFSQEELWALKDVEAELERMYRTEVPKYNIVRLGLHMLLEDYFQKKNESFLVRKLHLHKA
jgi:hypothetical protein